jgi:hypothetical protein
VHLSCSHFSQIDNFFQAYLFCYIKVFLLFITAVAVIIYIRITQIAIANHFLEISLLTFGFIFLLLDERREFYRLEFDHFCGGDNSMRTLVCVYS